MVNITTINGDSEEIITILKKYEEWINSITDLIWEGKSKDNLKNQASEFLNTYRSPVEIQMSTLAEAVATFDLYKEKKLIAKQKQTDYDTALKNQDDAASSLLDQLNAANSDVEGLKNTINSLLETIISLNLSGSTRGDFINYYQTDYANVSYGYGKSISDAGCGPTSMAMVLTYLIGEEVDPVEAAEYSMENNFRIKDNGTSRNYFEDIAEEYNIECERMYTVNKNNIISNLENEEILILHVGPGHFTGGGHYIVLTGLTEDGKITVADPNSTTRSSKTWDINILIREGDEMWSFTE